MSDEAQTALEQRLAWCEAQLRNVRKRMFSMGILIALLAVLLIWRTKMPHDLVRSGGAARFSTLEVVDQYGHRTMLDGASILLGDDEDNEDKTYLRAPSDGDPALSIVRSGRGLSLYPGQLKMGFENGSIEIDSGMLRFYRWREMRSGGAAIEAEAGIGPGFVTVRDLGGDAVLDARKEGFGVRLRTPDGKTEHIKPR